MHPSSSRAFQRDQEHDLKHPGLVDLIGTKQNETNKQPCFIDRYTKILHIKKLKNKCKTLHMNPAAGALADTNFEANL
jgi:hypothetical protein